MEYFTQTVFILLYWAGWVTLAVITLGLFAFLFWFYTTSRQPPTQPRQQIDYTREDVE